MSESSYFFFFSEIWVNAHSYRPILIFFNIRIFSGPISCRLGLLFGCLFKNPTKNSSQFLTPRYRWWPLRLDGSRTMHAQLWWWSYILNKILYEPKTLDEWKRLWRRDQETCTRMVQHSCEFNIILQTSWKRCLTLNLICNVRYSIVYLQISLNHLSSYDWLLLSLSRQVDALMNDSMLMLQFMLQ